MEWKILSQGKSLISWIEMFVRAVASVVWCACVGVWWKDEGTVSMQAQYVRLQLKRHEQLWHCLPLKCVHVQCVLINSSVLNASGNMNIRWMVRSVKLLLTSLSLVREGSLLDVRQWCFERKGRIRNLTGWNVTHSIIIIRFFFALSEFCHVKRVLCEKEARCDNDKEKAPLFWMWRTNKLCVQVVLSVSDCFVKGYHVDTYEGGFCSVNMSCLD